MLVLTLWILAAIAIAAGFFGERVQKSLQLAQLRQNLTDKQIGLSNTRAEILFRLGTNYLSPYGLGQKVDGVALDDRRYQAEGTTIQLLDARALINLNVVGDEQLFRLLGALDVPADQRPRLIDTLRDYADDDGLRRLNGAESNEYIARGMAPPRDAALISPMELKNVLGWADTPALWQGVPVTDLTTVGDVVAINPNTAPWQVLASLPGITPEMARAIVARRQLEPLTVAMVDQMAGSNLQQFPPPAIAYPATSMRITQRADGLPWAIRYNVRLTPQSNLSPWQIDYFYRLEEKTGPGRATKTGDAVTSADTTALPPRPDIVAQPAFLPPF